MENKMFCYQCQETAGCTGCTIAGVCGKKPDVAAMQDLLIYVTKGLAAVTTCLRSEGKKVDEKINHLVTVNLFTTITNANFDKEAITARIEKTLAVKEDLLKSVKNPSALPAAAHWNGKRDEYEARAAVVGVLSTKDEDIRSLRELITYGLKGLSAYSKHANALLQDDGEVDAFIQRALAATLDDTLSADDLVALTLETGEVRRCRHGASGQGKYGSLRQSGDYEGRDRRQKESGYSDFRT
jgi:hydroxylamine reductase